MEDPYIPIFSFRNGYRICRVTDSHWLNNLWISMGIFSGMAPEARLAEFERAILANMNGGSIFFIQKDDQICRFLYWHQRKKQIVLLPFVSRTENELKVQVDSHPTFDLDAVFQVGEYFSIVSHGSHPPPESEELQPSLQIPDDVEMRRNLDLPMSWITPDEEFLQFLND